MISSLLIVFQPLGCGLGVGCGSHGKTFFVELYLCVMLSVYSVGAYAGSQDHKGCGNLIGYEAEILGSREFLCQVTYLLGREDLGQGVTHL